MSGIIGKSKARGSGIIATDGGVTSVSGSTGVVADSDIDHDSLGNFASNEHFTQASITALGTVTSGTISTGTVVDDPTMTQGSDATGDVYYRAADGKLTRLATGADGTVLTSTGAGAVPAFEAATGGLSGMTSDGTDITVSTGNLIINTADKGISFTAGSDPDSNATVTGNILWDYEEGTWTPLDTDSSKTGTSYGMYTKIGDLITASFFLETSSISGTDRFYLKSLPFTCGSTSSFRGAVAIGYQDTSNVLHGGYVGESSTQAYMMIGSGDIAEDGEVGANKTLSGTLFYRV